eukprot:TRINITY_DN2713_c0_g1_i3.p1 TRINITY_DN2713_c0_g1~~TRINITY_DN2713_c0_g1_i3.p1  ORF type:complete len:733 (+),score=191.78 TRINITY_DN2713_c0_g1_i3:155-2353(+)
MISLQTFEKSTNSAEAVVAPQSHQQVSQVVPDEEIASLTAMLGPLYMSPIPTPTTTPVSSPVHKKGKMNFRKTDKKFRAILQENYDENESRMLIGRYLRSLFQSPFHEVTHRCNFVNTYVRDTKTDYMESNGFFFSVPLDLIQKLIKGVPGISARVEKVVLDHYPILRKKKFYPVAQLAIYDIVWSIIYPGVFGLISEFQAELDRDWHDLIQECGHKMSIDQFLLPNELWKIPESSFSVFPPREGPLSSDAFAPTPFSSTESQDESSEEFDTVQFSVEESEDESEDGEGEGERGEERANVEASPSRLTRSDGDILGPLTDAIFNLPAVLFSPSKLSSSKESVSKLSSSKESVPKLSSSRESVPPVAMRRSGPVSSPTKRREDVYERAIEELKKLPRQYCLLKKFRCLDATMRILLSETKLFTETHYNAALHVSASELTPLFSYVLIKSGIPNAHAESMFMELLLPSIKGKEGYLLTTFQASVEAAKQFLAEKLTDSGQISRKNAQKENQKEANNKRPSYPDEEQQRTEAEEKARKIEQYLRGDTPEESRKESHSSAYDQRHEQQRIGRQSEYQREQHQREQHQREQHQREQYQREQYQREQYQREQYQREQFQREQYKREQHQRDQYQRDQNTRKHQRGEDTRGKYLREEGLGTKYFAEPQKVQHRDQYQGEYIRGGYPRNQEYLRGSSTSSGSRGSRGSRGVFKEEEVDWRVEELVQGMKHFFGEDDDDEY